MKRIAGNALLAVAATGVAGAMLWVAGEGILRWTVGVGAHQDARDWTVFHEERGWALKPGTYEIFDVATFRRASIAVNRLGFRDRDVSLRVPPGKTRVTVLGDSFVFARVLEARERLTEHLEMLGDGRTEVVNVSVPGYGTGQQTLFLEELLDQGYEPGSRVVLTFFTNDILDNMGLDYGTLERNPQQPVFHVDSTGALRHSRPDPPVAPQGDGAPRWDPVARSVFLRFLNHRLTIFAGNNPWVLDVLEAAGRPVKLPRMPGVIAAWYGDGWEKRLSVTRDLLAYLDRRVDGVGKGGSGEAEGPAGTRPSLTVMFIPSPFQVEPVFRRLVESHAAQDPRYEAFLADMDRPQRALRETCASLEIPFVDTTPALREAGERGSMFFLQEGHLNAEGSARVATVLHDALEDALERNVDEGDRGGPPRAQTAAVAGL